MFSVRCVNNSISKLASSNTRFFDYRFYFIFLVAVFIVAAEAKTGLQGTMDEVEDEIYKTIGGLIVASGKSKEYASCFIFMLKLQGTSDDVTKFSNLINPTNLVDKLLENSKFADTVCSNGHLVAFLLVILFILIIICICRVCFSCLEWIFCCSSNDRSPRNKKTSQLMERFQKEELDMQDQSLYYSA